MSIVPSQAFPFLASIALPAFVGLLLVGCGPQGPSAAQIDLWKQKADEREEFAREIAALRISHDRHLAQCAELEVQLSKLQDEMAARDVQEFVLGGREDQEKETLRELAQKQQEQIEALNRLIEALEKEKEEILADKRQARRDRMIGTEIGTLLVGDQPFFNAKVNDLTPAWLDLGHRDGAERMMLELLPVKLQTRFEYHPDEAVAFLDLHREEEMKKVADEQARKQEEARLEEERRKQAAADKLARDHAGKKAAVRTIKDEIKKSQAVIAAELQRHAAARAQGKISSRRSLITQHQERIESLRRDLRKAEITLVEFEIDNGLR